MVDRDYLESAPFTTKIARSRNHPSHPYHYLLEAFSPQVSVVVSLIPSPTAASGVLPSMLSLLMTSQSSICVYRETPTCHHLDYRLRSRIEGRKEVITVLVVQEDAVSECVCSNAFNVIVETDGTPKRDQEGVVNNPRSELGMLIL